MGLGRGSRKAQESEGGKEGTKSEGGRKEKREHLLVMTNAEIDRMTYNSWTTASTLFMLSRVAVAQRQGGREGG